MSARRPRMVSSDAIGVVVDCRMQASASRLVHVHFEPHQVERLDLLGDAAEALGLVVEIDDRPRCARFGPAPSRKAVSCAISASSISSGRLSSGWPGAARGARRVLAAAVLVEHQEVRLDRLVAEVARLARGGLEVVDGVHRRACRSPCRRNTRRSVPGSPRSATSRPGCGRAPRRRTARRPGTPSALPLMSRQALRIAPAAFWLSPPGTVRVNE